MTKLMGTSENPAWLHSLGPFAIAYTAASLATLIKTVAWWFNQWPFIKGLNFFLKWIMSASIAGFEYLPLTYSFQYANANGVHLSLMTAYMEAADNGFRMLQQLCLGDRLDWFDWVAASVLALCVIFQGIFHYRLENHKYRPSKAKDSNKMNYEKVDLVQNESSNMDDIELHDPTTATISHNVIQKEETIQLSPLFVKSAIITMVILLAVISLTSSLLGGATGQSYALATLATAAKTFAWWINQYPTLKNFSFIQKWLAGWSIAATVEYLPLIGAFTVASSNNVHLGLMTAYMEAIDNLFRMIQQYMLGKPLYWFDYISAAGMFVAVLFQGIMHYFSEQK